MSSEETSAILRAPHRETTMTTIDPFTTLSTQGTESDNTRVMSNVPSSAQSTSVQKPPEPQQEPDAHIDGSSRDRGTTNNNFSNAETSFGGATQIISPCDNAASDEHSSAIRSKHATMMPDPTPEELMRRPSKEIIPGPSAAVTPQSIRVTEAVGSQGETRSPLTTDQHMDSSHQENPKLPIIAVEVPQTKTTPNENSGAELTTSSEDNDDSEDSNYETEFEEADEPQLSKFPRSRKGLKRSLTPSRPRNVKKTRLDLGQVPATSSSRGALWNFRSSVLERCGHCRCDSQYTPNPAPSCAIEPRHIPVNGYLELSPGGLRTSIVLNAVTPYDFTGSLFNQPSTSATIRYNSTSTDGADSDSGPHNQSLHRRRKRARFTKEEDALLIELKQGGLKWKDMEQYFNGREWSSLQTRWSRYLQSDTRSQHVCNH
ncbi:hypothetical protein AWENTII_003222 [Aspergillus wentii]